MKLKQRKSILLTGQENIKTDMIQKINQHLKFDFVGDIKI